jgi:hypothetical protein
VTEDNDLTPRGLGVFADYVNAQGSARMKIIADQRKRFEDPNSGAPYAYAAALGGIRHALRTSDEVELRRMVFKASRTMVAHYEELADGAEAFLRRYKPQFVPTHSATWQWAALTITVNQHVGVAIKGTPTVVFLYLKQPELSSEGATKVAWRTLEQTTDKTLPGAAVAVLDVRRGKLWTPTKVGRPKLDAWITGEAHGYIEHWKRAAA